MAIELAIRDFQIIRKAQLVFEPGVTLITGPNSSGKSSIFRALKALILNNASKRSIRAGAPHAAVAIRIDGGKKIVWTRTENAIEYQVDGVRFTKAGRTSLFEVDPTFPLLLDPESGKIVNMQGEWDVLFPFEKSPSELFKLFEDIFQISNSATVIESIKRDGLEIKEKEAQIQRSKALNLEKFDVVSGYLATAPLVELKERRDEYRQLDQRLKGLVVDVVEAQQASVLKDLEVPEKTFDTSAIRRLLLVEEDLTEVGVLVEYLKVKVPEKTFDTVCIGTLTDVDRALTEAEALLQLVGIEIVNFTQDTSGLDKFGVVESDWEMASKVHDEIVVLCGQYQGNIDRARELESEKATFKVCPLCNQPMEAKG